MSKKTNRRHDRPAPAPEPTGRLVRRIRDVDRPEPLTDAEAVRWLIDAVRAQRTHGTPGATHVLRACPRPGDVLLMAVRAYALQLEDTPDAIVDAVLEDADAALALLDLDLPDLRDGLDS